MERISPTELQARLEAGDRPVLVDVREAEELEICRLEGIVHIPLGELAARWEELDPSRETVLICHHGIRSARACGLLASRGFGRAVNLTGGMDAWARAVDPGMPTY